MLRLVPLVKKAFVTSGWTGKDFPRHDDPLRVFPEAERLLGGKPAKSDCSLEYGMSRRISPPFPPYTPPGTMDIRKGCGPLGLFRSHLTIHTIHTMLWIVFYETQDIVYLAG